MRTFATIPTLVLALCLCFPSLNSAQQKSDYFERGLKAKNENNIKRALNIWLSARNKIIHPDHIDPRIGFHFIRTVTERRMYKYYDTATLMYNWALYSSDINSFKPTLKEELRRLKPIISSQQFDRWKSLLENNDQQALDEIKSFWFRLDPTPGTLRNERLLEHWERLAYVQNNFLKSSSDIVNYDDRGKIYIKYGHPQRKSDGTLFFDRSWIKFKANEILTQSSSSVKQADYNIDLIRQKQSIVNKVIQQAEQAHDNPEFEIWIYDGLVPESDENIIFMFGKGGNQNSFGLIDSIEDLIPNNAFRNILQPDEDKKITGGLLLQLYYYRQLIDIDPFFANVFQGLDSKALNVSGFSFSLSKTTRIETEATLKGSINNAPVQKSTYRPILPAFELNIYQYRLLDEENKPYLATYIESLPQRVILTDYNLQQQNNSASYTDFSSLLNHYKLQHSVILQNKVGELVDNYQDFPVVTINPGLAEENVTPSTSIYTVPHIDEGAPQNFAAVIFNDKIESTGTNGDQLYPQSIRSVGKKIISQPELLNSNPKQLEMGDLILGYKQSDTDKQLNYKIAHERTIPYGHDLSVHFELYHLKIPASGMSEIALNYRIDPIGKQKANESGVQLSLSYQSHTPSLKEDLEIKTNEFVPGEYLLRLEGVDKSSKQKVSRSVRFEIKEK